jgi:hypothetical protein
MAIQLLVDSDSRRQNRIFLTRSMIFWLLWQSNCWSTPTHDGNAVSTRRMGWQVLDENEHAAD